MAGALPFCGRCAAWPVAASSRAPCRAAPFPLLATTCFLIIFGVLEVAAALSASSADAGVGAGAPVVALADVNADGVYVR